MVNVTVSVPENLKQRMERLKGINWSEVARNAFEEAARRQERLSAANAIKRLREKSGPGWSGAREVRKWRDAGR
jgi:hypothetical protein